MSKRRMMRATITVYGAVDYDVTVRFASYDGDDAERQRFDAEQMFRFIGMDVKPYQTITIEEDAK